VTRASRRLDVADPKPERRPRVVPASERSPKLVVGRGERRDRVRCEVHIDIDGESGHDSFSGVTRDLSQAGAFIATERALAVGTLVQLRLHLPASSQPSRCVGEVRWQRAADPTKDEPQGLGLRFVLLEPDARRAIQAFLVARAPNLLDD
jgi:uncharacterized protein (TIGR02266 family)